MRTSLSGAVLVAVLAGSLASCGLFGGSEGSLGVAVAGSGLTDATIPSAAFVDGWSVKFDRFLVSVGPVAIGRTEGTADLSEPGSLVYDLATMKNAYGMRLADVPSGTYAWTAYTVGPATASTLAGNVQDDALKTMVDNGWSLLVEGKATKGTRTVAFSWGFANRTDYGPCASTAVLKTDGEATIELTVHADHLFRDRAVGETTSLRFDEVAMADADGNGTVTRAELEAFEIGAISTLDAGGLALDTLWDWLVHSTTTLGRVDGEGTCQAG
jgi:hypothetical protein